jgi:hypothetical protein
MAVSWCVDAVVLLESDEHATFQEWTAAVAEALADPGFRPGMGVVHDLRRMTRVPTPAEARARVDFLVARSRALQVSRWAIVVAGAAHYGMGRLAEFHADKMPGQGFRVFRELEPALAWASGHLADPGSVA